MTSPRLECQTLVQNNEPDRLVALLEESANRIEELESNENY